MPDFDFITDEDLRAALEQDNRELTACMSAQAWKAAHVLAGSIIEAVLIDHIASFPKRPPKSSLEMDLGELIRWCRAEGILSDKSQNLSVVVKDYRNLIHPGRVLRLREKVDRNGAVLAQTLIDVIVEEIATKKRETYGFTAEQIVRKLTQDSTAIAIIKHLLRKTNVREIERLLMTVIPESYFAASHDDDSRFGLCEDLAKCFRVAFEIAPTELKRKTIERLLCALQQDDEGQVYIRGVVFFKAADLEYANEEERTLIKDHFLSRLQGDFPDEVLDAGDGIGRYLIGDEVKRFALPLLHKHLFGDGKHDPKQRLVSEYHRMSAEAQHAVDGYLAWIEKNEREAPDHQTDSVLAAVASLQDSLAVPF